MTHETAEAFEHFGYLILYIVVCFAGFWISDDQTGMRWVRRAWWFAAVCQVPGLFW